MLAKTKTLAVQSCAAHTNAIWLRLEKDPAWLQGLSSDCQAGLAAFVANGLSNEGEENPLCVIDDNLETGIQAQYPEVSQYIFIKK